MAKTPQELSSEIIIHHPNCGTDFQFREFDEENQLNYFQCVGCGLALRMQAFDPSDPGDHTDTENTTEQAAEPEAATSVDVGHSGDQAPPKQRHNSRKKVEPDHIR